MAKQRPAGPTNSVRGDDTALEASLGSGASETDDQGADVHLRALAQDRRPLAIATDVNGKDRIYCSDGSVWRCTSEPHDKAPWKFELVGQIPGTTPIDQVDAP